MTPRARDERTPLPSILIVEDNEMNRDMLSRRLQRRGYEVVIAVDGERGVAMAKSEAPDLILMDMSLPIMDGWEATRTLKAAPETGSIPVIALTAHAMAEEKIRTKAAGCDDHLTKPLNKFKLIETISRLVQHA